MKLYLADEKRINVFDLPQKVAESFLFSYTPTFTNIETFFNVISEDDHWILKANDDFMVNGENKDTILEEYHSYEIKIKGIVDSFYLYTYDTYNNNYWEIITKDIPVYTIGNDPADSIVYSDENSIPKQVIITVENGITYIQLSKESKTNLYINKKRITEKTILNCGDYIFINNLKIMWMNEYARVFIPNDKVKFSSNSIFKEKEDANNEKYLDYPIKENDQGLYKEQDFFYHKPRLVTSYGEEELTIDAPTPKETKDDLPFLLSIGAGLTLIVSGVFTIYRVIAQYHEGIVGKTELIFIIISSLVLIFSSFLVPKLTTSYNKKRAQKRDAIREVKYTEYLGKKQAKINEILTYEKNTLLNVNPSGKECYDSIVGVKNRLWERELSDNDFAAIRLGLGVINSSLSIKAPEERFTIDEDTLLNKAFEMVENSKYLRDVPITLSLTKNIVSSIINSSANADDYMNGILLQLLCLQNPKDLKIVFLTDEKNAQKWDYLKLVPHIYSDDKSVRFFASNEDEAKKLLKDIDELYEERREQIQNSSTDINEELDTHYYKNYSPYYLIITDSYRKYKNLSFLTKLVNFNENIGFSLLMFDNTLKNLPSQCMKYAYINDKGSALFERNSNSNSEKTFTPDIEKNLDTYRVARELSNVPVQTIQELYNLPTMISFLEMYNVGNIEQLNILNKWYSSNPMTTLMCPIGVSPSGELFKLDLHEKAHGPHGLIAGATGSGKSEFIITYILSMAVSYHPDEVKFVLIDYKGGSLAGAFENKETGVKLPHLAGTITNLDISDLNRTLVSINSEMKRRQKKFNEVRDKLGESTIDIYKYQKYYREGLITEPIPHLFIISDEFAELKQQQPDFMDELISTARIGRSLGVHLILATQKPSGIVNDQIWSNSKFKICLKVQTKNDSMEMLKRPDAASLKETGRFYLQVGYDELFELGQSAWAGAQYIPTEKVVKKVDDSINFVDNTGDIIKSANNISKDSENIKRTDQLTNIVKYLYNIAKKNDIKSTQLWLDSIPQEIFLPNLAIKYNYQTKPYIINPIIGEYDDPESQMQGLLTVDLTNTGNLLLYGIPASGKENFLTTLITSICSKHTTDEVNIYIMDFGAETLSKFKDFPQVGDIMTIEETERINSLYSFLVKEINKRKELFADYMGSYTNYIKNSGKKLPNIIVIMHQYETFPDAFPSLSDKFLNLFKDGPKFGITFVVTNSLSNSMRIKTTQLFPNKMALKLADPDDYRYTLDTTKTVIPANYFGRGLAKLNKPLEFQTAYISKPDEINKTVADLATNLKSLKLKKAPKIPSMPNFLTVDKLISNNITLDKVPVGISKAKLNLVYYNFTSNYTPVISSDPASNMHFVYGLIELLKQVPNTKVRIIDVLGLYNNNQGVKVFNEDFNTIIKQLRLEAYNDEKLDHTNIFIIIGLGAFKNNVEEKIQHIFSDVFTDLKTYKNNKYIIYDDYNSYKSLEFEPWYRANVDPSAGIWLGDNASNQLSIKMPNLTMDERKIMFNQIGYVVKNSAHTIIRYVVDKEFDDEK